MLSSGRGIHIYLYNIYICPVICRSISVCPRYVPYVHPNPIYIVYKVLGSMHP